jgi:hypothetical protein
MVRTSLWSGCVHSVMQRPSVILLKPLSNKKPIIKKYNTQTHRQRNPHIKSTGG